MRLEDVSINTIVGPNTMITGNLCVAGFARIDGTVDGNVTASGRLIIGEHSRIRGDVEAKAIIAGGVIEGDIISTDSVHLLASAVVLGSVLTKSLVIEEGVLVHGFCSGTHNDEQFSKVRKMYVDKKAVHASTLLHRR